MWGIGDKGVSEDTIVSAMNAVVSVRHCRTTFCSPVLAILQDPSSVVP
jgi:hypothetical protein